MYELVKKKNIGIRILTGILIFFLITQALKFLLREPSLNINDELVKSANEANKHAPMILDSLTRFDYVQVLPGNTLLYNYTILKFERSRIDTINLMKLAREYFIDFLKKNPNASYFRKNEIKIQANYVDKNGAQLCRISISPKEY